MELVQKRQRDGHGDAEGAKGSGLVSRDVPSVQERRVDGVAGWLLGLVRHPGGGERRSLKVLETLHLGGRRQVMLVSCAGEQYLIGMGSDSVESIVRVGESSKKVAPEDVCL